MIHPHRYRQWCRFYAVDSQGENDIRWRLALPATGRGFTAWTRYPVRAMWVHLRREPGTRYVRHIGIRRENDFLDLVPEVLQ